MTATQPEIVDDPYPLIQDRSRYFEGRVPDSDETVPDRVEYEFDATALATEDEAVLGYDEAATRLVAVTAGTTDSTLAICNTIDSARELTEAIEERYGTEEITDISDLYDESLGNSFGGLPLHEERDGKTVATQERGRFVERVRDECDGLALLHLTTRIRPCDRRALLQIAADLTASDVPLVVVSTQLVEAGVDLSFDRVYRDFGPLDSIVQAAGRCNRSYEREIGTVTVWRLGPPEDREKVPSEVVYAQVHKQGEQNLLRKTRNALESEVLPRVDGSLHGSPVGESLLTTDAVEAYHERIGADMVDTKKGNDLVDYYEKAKARSLHRESLIDHRLTFEVYVCRTQAEYERVEALREARDDWDFERVEKLKQSLRELRVSVPVYTRNSDVSKELVEVDPLSTWKDKSASDDQTERVIDATDADSTHFDLREGVHLSESGVEARFF